MFLEAGAAPHGGRSPPPQALPAVSPSGRKAAPPWWEDGSGLRRGDGSGLLRAGTAGRPCGEAAHRPPPEAGGGLRPGGAEGLPAVLLRGAAARPQKNKTRKTAVLRAWFGAYR